MAGKEQAEKYSCRKCGQETGGVKLARLHSDPARRHTLTIPDLCYWCAQEEVGALDAEKDLVLAIKHAEDVASAPVSGPCGAACAEDHARLVKWLTELLWRRQGRPGVP